MRVESPSNRKFLDRLLAVECRDATYPVSDSPLVFAKAFGSEIEDCEGRRYIDLCAGFGALPLGHNHPVIRAAMRRWTEDDLSPPIEHGMGDVYPAVAKIEIIELLLSLMPDHLRRASLALTGSQAVEIALKTAMQATGHTGFIAFKNGYHGVDLGVLPVTSRADFSAPFKNWISGATVLELPYGAPKTEVRAAIATLKKSPAGFAGLIVEPVQGRAGVVCPPSGWLGSLLTETHAGGGLLIFDEIFTGLGRLGIWTTASEVAADLICLGKALGGGFPLSACVGTEAAMNAWPQSRGEAIHTGTFFGHPFTCAMAAATLNEMRAMKLPEAAARRGANLLADLKNRFGGDDSIADIRGQGMMLAVEFKKDGEGVRVMDTLRKHGVIALVSGARGQVLSLTPALNIPEANVQAALKSLDVVLN